MLEYKTLKFAAKEDIYAVVWEGSMPLLDIYFFIKVVKNLEWVRFGDGKGEEYVLNKDFLQRCSFGKFLEYVYHINILMGEPKFLKLRAKGTSPEEILALLEVRVNGYTKKTSLRSFR